MIRPCRRFFDLCADFRARHEFRRYAGLGTLVATAVAMLPVSTDALAQSGWNPFGDQQGVSAPPARKAPRATVPDSARVPGSPGPPDDSMPGRWPNNPPGPFPPGPYPSSPIPSIAAGGGYAPPYGPAAGSGPRDVVEKSDLPPLEASPADDGSALVGIARELQVPFRSIAQSRTKRAL